MAFSAQEEKDWMNISTMGHIGHGKSTLMGYVLVKLGVVDQREFEEIAKEAIRLGKEDKTYAFIFDRRKEERERGISIAPFHYGFSWKDFNFMVIDCPGHKDFVKNMILGVTQADAGVLLIAANDFETALKSYIRKKYQWFIGQAREHSLIARALGMKQIVTVVSKMDEVKWSESTFQTVVANAHKLLRSVGYNEANLKFVPVGGRPLEGYGENVLTPSELMKWYQGPTFIQALETLEAPKRLSEYPLRLPVERVYHCVPGVMMVVCGRIETGKIRVNDEIIFQPSNVTGKVRSIKMRDERVCPTRVNRWGKIEEAPAGGIIGVGMRDIEASKALRLEGNVISLLDDQPTVAKDFIAETYTLWHPSKIKIGYEPMIHVGTAHASCMYEELLRSENILSGEQKVNPKSLRPGDLATVRFRLDPPIVVEEHDRLPRLGRFVIRDHGLTVAGGRVVKVNP